MPVVSVSVSVCLSVAGHNIHILLPAVAAVFAAAHNIPAVVVATAVHSDHTPEAGPGVASRSRHVTGQVGVGGLLVVVAVVVDAEAEYIQVGSELCMVVAGAAVAASRCHIPWAAAEPPCQYSYRWC